MYYQSKALSRLAKVKCKRLSLSVTSKPHCLSHLAAHTNTQHRNATQGHPGMATDSHLSATSTDPHDLQAWHATLFSLERQGVDLVQMLQVKAQMTERERKLQRCQKVCSLHSVDTIFL